MRSRHDRPIASGFSLAELVITVLILGILAAAATPRYFEAVSRYRVDAAAKRIAADLEFARHNAKTTGVTQEVSFAVSTETYSLPGVADPDHPGASYAVRLSETSYPADLQSVSFGESGNDNKIYFDMYGKPDFGGAVLVVAAGNQRTITVDGDTGKVTITP